MDGKIVPMAAICSQIAMGHMGAAPEEAPVEVLEAVKQFQYLAVAKRKADFSHGSASLFRQMKKAGCQLGLFRGAAAAKIIIKNLPD